MTETKKTSLKKAAKKSRKKTATPTKPLLFHINVKSNLQVDGIIPEAGHQTKYKAVCTFEQIDLTDWTNETTADNAAAKHRHDYLHPVTVLESH